MAQTVNVGLLGCGRIAQVFHLRILSALPGTRVAALADADATLLEQAGARAPQAERFSDYRDLLARASIDAVVICLPTGLHAPAAAEAFEASRHVYLEKPLAISNEQADRVMAAWRDAGRIGMMGFNYRRHPLHVEARARIAAGEIGAVVGIQSAFCSASRELPPWKRSRASGGGVLLDLASHHIDLARFHVGEVERVWARLADRRTEQDTAALDLTLEGGISMRSFHTMAGPHLDRMTFVGESGFLSVDRYAGRLEVGGPHPPSSRSAWLKRAPGRIGRTLADVIRPPGEPSFQRSLEVFVDAVRRGEPTTPTLEAGERAWRVVDAAERAAAQGEPTAP